MKIKRYFFCKPYTDNDYFYGQFCLGVVTECGKVYYFESSTRLTSKSIRKILRKIRKGKYGS